MSRSSSDESNGRILFLARGRNTGYGYLWPAEVLDGPHSTVDGVIKAAAIYKRAGLDDGPWIMVEALPLSRDISSDGLEREA